MNEAQAQTARKPVNRSPRSWREARARCRPTISPTATDLAKQGRPSPLPSSSRYGAAAVIARDGLGTVYLAAERGDASRMKPLVLTRIDRHLVEEASARRRVVDEARLAARVRHPNILAVVDVEEVEEEVLIVTDFTEGSALSDVIQASVRVPRNIALRIVLDACAGLEALHDVKDDDGLPAPLVHRDISPRTILVGFDGVSRITDFGGAKGVRSSLAGPSGHGKYGYLAPEYLSSGHTTPSSDLFALGVVVWELLAGRRLFEGETNTDRLHLTMEAAVPRLEPHGIATPELDSCLQKILARSPEERYVDARAFGDALERATKSLVASREEVSSFVRAVTAAQSGQADESVSAESLPPSLCPFGIPMASLLPALSITSQLAPSESPFSVSITSQLAPPPEAIVLQPEASAQLRHPPIPADVVPEGVVVVPRLSPPPAIAPVTPESGSPWLAATGLALLLLAIVTSTTAVVYRGIEPPALKTSTGR